jgi:hypothetical protein
MEGLGLQRKSIRRVLCSVVLAAAPVAGIALGATSAQAVTADIGAGTLTIQAPSTFVWNNPSPGQTVVVTLPVIVTDATGSGNGWNADASMTTFRDATTGKAVTATVKLNGSTSGGTATVGPTARCAVGSTCKLPVPSTSAVTYPHVVPIGTPAPTATPFATAADRTGMGIIDMPFDAWLRLTSSASDGAYTTSFIVSIVSGP